jgi:lysophospholipase L1-like esterase
MTLFIGDSLTRGTVGFTYIKFLKSKNNKNKGKNGDTTYGALTRLTKYRRKKWYGDVKTCVVAIGTNDILRPFLYETSMGFRLLCKRRDEKKNCAPEPADFESHYRELLGILKEDGKNVVLVGLPMIQLKNFPLDKLHEYNGIIKKLAQANGMKFVDILRLQEIERPNCRKDYNWGQVCLVRGIDILLMGLVPVTKNLFSKARGLELTVDGVHLSRFSANLLAEELDRKMKR